MISRQSNLGGDHEIEIQVSHRSRRWRCYRRSSRQGVQALAKPKAHGVSESKVLAPSATTAYNPALQAAQKAAGGRSFRTTCRIIAVVGTAPKRVSISEWDSLEQAQAWQNSEARKNLEPQRGKAIKITRQYIVESAN